MISTIEITRVNKNSMGTLSLWLGRIAVSLHVRICPFLQEELHDHVVTSKWCCLNGISVESSLGIHIRSPLASQLPHDLDVMLQSHADLHLCIAKSDIVHFGPRSRSSKEEKVGASIRTSVHMWRPTISYDSTSILSGARYRPTICMNACKWWLTLFPSGTP